MFVDSVYCCFTSLLCRVQILSYVLVCRPCVQSVCGFCRGRFGGVHVCVQTLLGAEVAALGPGAHGYASPRPATAPPHSVSLSAPGQAITRVQGAHRAPERTLEAGHRLGLGPCFPGARTRLVSRSGLLSVLASILGVTLSI